MSISKLVIKAYSNESFTTQKSEFSASINPANLKITSSVDYERSQGMGSANMALRYNVSPPKELSFRLIFDNTGIFPDSDKSVKDQIEALQDVVYKFQEDINSPYYVRVIWGVIDFKGKLVSLETSYTMFKSDGAPIRAEVDIVVLEDASASKIATAAKEAAKTVNTATAAVLATGAATGVAAAAVTVAAASVAVSPAINSATPSVAPDATTAGANALTESEIADASTPDTASTSATQPSQAGGTDASSTTPQNPDTKKIDETPGTTPAGAAATTTPTAVKEVPASDKLTSVAKSSLGDPNLAKSLGSVNGLDSLRNLTSGLSLAVPLTSLGLLAMLLAMAKKYGSKGATYLKSKAKAGKDKAVAVKDKVKSKI